MALTGERVPLVRMMALALVAISRKITSELKHQNPMTISGLLLTLSRKQKNKTIQVSAKDSYRISWFHTWPAGRMKDFHWLHRKCFVKQTRNRPEVDKNRCSSNAQSPQTPHRQRTFVVEILVFPWKFYGRLLQFAPVQSSKCLRTWLSVQDEKAHSRFVDLRKCQFWCQMSSLNCWTRKEHHSSMPELP